MGEVIQFKFAKSSVVCKNTSFTLKVEQDEDGFWSVSLLNFYNPSKSDAGQYREIASLLPTLMAGLIEIAERTEPNDRGNIVGAITIYSNGTIDMLMEPLDTNGKQTWMSTAVDKVRDFVAKAHKGRA